VSEPNVIPAVDVILPVDVNVPLTVVLPVIAAVPPTVVLPVIAAVPPIVVLPVTARVPDALRFVPLIAPALVSDATLLLNVILPEPVLVAIVSTFIVDIYFNSKV
jgi:hypothetical protein